MNDWDQKKLEEAVNFNETKYTAKTNTTEKICDHFLGAVEKKQYGWFWVCPNGHNCKYKHCLPPGYVLKTEGPKEEKKEFDVEKDIDDMIKVLHMGDYKGTPVTIERFNEWKEKRKERKAKEAELRKLDDFKKAGIKINKKKKILSGRALFVLDPTYIISDIFF